MVTVCAPVSATLNKPCDLLLQVVKTVCASVNMDPKRAVVLSRHDSTAMANKNAITLQIHRAVNADGRSPRDLAREIVEQVNAGALARQLPHVTGARVLVLSGDRHRRPAPVAALEYARHDGERVHLSQVRRQAVDAALERQCLSALAHSLSAMHSVVCLQVVGGVGLESELLELICRGEAMQRKLLAEVLAAALPEYAHDKYADAIVALADRMELLDVTPFGFEVCVCVYVCMCVCVCVCVCTCVRV